MLRPSRRRRRILAVSVVLCALFCLVSARLFVWPPTDRPTPVDAIVALGGDPGQQRAKAAVTLAAHHVAPIAVISLGGKGATCPPAPVGVRIICFRADPLDTRGEAEFVARLAARRHWRSIIVVPERTQVTRARLLFERCTKVRLEMVPVSDPFWHLPFDVLYEWGALSKALIWKTSC